MRPIIHPVIGAMFKIPTRLLEGRVNLSELRIELTAEHYDSETDETTPVPMYRDSPGYISLPRAYARETFPELWARALDRTTHPKRDPKLFPHKIKPRDEQQRDFWQKLQELFGSDNVSETQIKARTGSGKTVGHIVSNANVGNFPLLVVVHTNRLKNQWLGDIKLKKGLRFIFGEEWVEKNVGVIQQDVCDYKDKLIVIGMGPSLARRKYPKEMYSYFSGVGIDEIHKFATPMLANVLTKFAACHLSAMSATPKKGPMAKVINAFLGKPKITSEQEVLRPIVTRVKFEARRNWYDYKTGKPLENPRVFANYLAKDKQRQTLLTDIIIKRGWNRDRQILVLSDRVGQLQDLQQRLIDRGVDAEAIGLYVGAYETGKIKLTGYIQCGDKKRHFRGIEGFAKSSQVDKYIRDAAKALAEQAGREFKDVIYVCTRSPEKLKPTEQEYQFIENHCQIVLATYQIFADGLDISRLNWGLEALPRGDVEQAVGRVCRLAEGKATPEWISIFDNIWTEAKRELPGGTIHTIKYVYKEPKKLELRRRASYVRQNAILKQVDYSGEAH